MFAVLNISVSNKIVPCLKYDYVALCCVTIKKQIHLILLKGTQRETQDKQKHTFTTKQENNLQILLNN